MKTLYIDGFAGISGDMFLGALIDAGAEAADIREQLGTVPLEGYSFSTGRVVKNGIAATKVYIETTGPHGHRRLPDILQLLEESRLSARVREQSTRVFQALAGAEAKIHGLPVEQVHFHEVGAIDSILDILGSIIALEILGVEDIACSPLPLGAGFVRCAHGTLPLPAPATLELLAGVPTTACNITGETVTPTGAALVKTLSSSFGPMPPMVIDRIGYGAGSADREIPNVVRLILGNVLSQGGYGHDTLWILEANIDDMNPEFFPYIMDSCLSSGAADAFLTPVLMKKGRPGHLLSVLCRESDIDALVDVILRETTTLGLRYYAVERRKLHREIISVDTCYGPVRIKVGRHPVTGEIFNTAPEWESCREAAQSCNAPVKTVYDAAKTAARQKLTGGHTV